MLFSDRRGFLAALAAVSLTSACGFRPVYGSGGQGTALRGAMRVDDPVSRADFQFVSAFEDALGRPTAPRYGVAYTITQTEVGSGLLQNLGATRVQIFGTLDFAVTDLASGVEVASGQVASNTTYSTTGTQLSTLTAAEDAELRLMRILAEALVTRFYPNRALRPQPKRHEAIAS